LAKFRHEALHAAAYHPARALAEQAITDWLWARDQSRVEVTGRAQFDDLVRSSWAFTALMDSWWPELSPVDALARLTDPASVAQVAGDLLSSQAAADLAASITPGDWTVADIALLDELADLLGPVPAVEDDDNIFGTDPIEEIATITDRLTDRRDLSEETLHDTYSHILVDEAQDITPMQWRMIHRRGPQASWTILGDLTQSNWPDPQAPAAALDALIGQRERRAFRLSTNYRSPKEAYDLATAYIAGHEPNVDIAAAVRSTGVEPRLLVAPAGELAATLRAELLGLLDAVEGTIGVIAEPAHNQAVFEALLGLDRRVSAMDPLSSKGLEFDAVAVVDPDSIERAHPGGARTLYVALTRPTQRLVTIDLDQPGDWRPAGY